ncbi:hypothetical protein H072_1539 [Dactylellina haptotyla CBS 200.50]|uniref:Tc toxin complex TcA C-terminal TcB-binding domain-containing protein n=1 Tax=Dactylellina haptotyla (strain CBS 200.50) TaxID=1284197 RepID=S8BY79_DACHA|nr:hypothetical protein H072_1539 [Dactylellina haptotyla CBS 200.50]
MVAFSKLSLLLSATAVALPSTFAIPLTSPRDLVQYSKRQNDPALAQRYDAILSNVELNEYATTLYQNYRGKDSKRVFLRKPYMNLGEAISTVKAKITNYSAEIYIYTDLLQFAGNTAIEVPKRTTLYLFAREVSALASQQGAMTIKYDQSVVVFFATPELPGNFPVKFMDAAGGTHEISITVPDDAYGVIVEVVAGGPTPTPEPVDAPDFALKAMDYMGDLSLTAETFVEDDLPRLLQFQQVLATAWKASNPQLAMKIYNYIVKTTNNSAPALPIYKQAITSLSKLKLISDPLQKYVPNLNISQIKLVLDDHLAVAQTFEESFNAFSQQQANAQTAVDTAMDAFTNSKLAVEKYKFLEGQAKARLEFAVQAMNDAVFNYNQTYNDLPLRLKTFQSGIAEWATDQMGKFLLNVFMAVGTIVLTIGAGAIGAAALPATAVGGSLPFKDITSAMNVIREAESATDNVKAAADSIKYMVDNISKALTMMASTMTTLNTLLATTLPALKPEGFQVKSYNIPVDPLERVDIINLSASWDNWRVLNELSWSKLSESQKKIDGAAEYYGALYALSNNGKAVVAAQAAYIQIFDDYMEASVNLQTAQAQNQVLQGAVNRLQDPLVFQTFKRAMFDRLIAVRSWVAVEFNDYASAYQYYTLSTEPPAFVPVMSPASYYTSAVADLQSDATHAQTTFRSQIQTFSISSTDAGNIFGTNWKNDIQTLSGLTFSIPTNSSYFSSVSRVRVQKLRCYLVGSTSEEVRTTVTISGAFEDKGLSYPYNPLKFVSDSTPLGFYYVPSSNDPNEANTNLIRQDGLYARQNVFMTPTPFAVWNIKVEDAAKALQGVSKLVLLVTAEVTHH